MAADIRNAYLQAPTSENHFIICDADLHGIKNAGKRAIVLCDLYGGKLAGRDLCKHLRACMDTLGFTSCFSDETWEWNSLILVCTLIC